MTCSAMPGPYLSTILATWLTYEDFRALSAYSVSADGGGKPVTIS